MDPTDKGGPPGGALEGQGQSATSGAVRRPGLRPEHLGEPGAVSGGSRQLRVPETSFLWLWPEGDWGGGRHPHPVSGLGPAQPRSPWGLAVDSHAGSLPAASHQLTPRPRASLSRTHSSHGDGDGPAPQERPQAFSHLPGALAPCRPPVLVLGLVPSMPLACLNQRPDLPGVCLSLRGRHHSPSGPAVTLLDTLSSLCPLVHSHPRAFAPAVSLPAVPPHLFLCSLPHFMSCQVKGPILGGLPCLPLCTLSLLDPPRLLCDTRAAQQKLHSLFTYELSNSLPRTEIPLKQRVSLPCS